jgi:hypothetical protein
MKPECVMRVRTITMKKRAPDMSNPALLREKKQTRTVKKGISNEYPDSQE